MDKIDKKLIELLQKNARYTLKELAEQVFLSSPAVAVRLEKLESQGIISGYHAEVNPAHFGYHIEAYINVSMQPKKKLTFKPFIDAFPNVLECSMVTGDNTMIVKAIFGSTTDLEEFVMKLQKFGKTSTAIVFSEIVPARGLVVKQD